VAKALRVELRWLPATPEKKKLGKVEKWGANHYVHVGKVGPQVFPRGVSTHTLNSAWTDRHGKEYDSIFLIFVLLFKVFFVF
jgi:hypothetical protein